MTDTGPLDEDAVAEIPPGQAKAGSVQGGGSDIVAGGDTTSDTDSLGDTATAGDTDRASEARLDDLEVEIVDQDKGATGE